LKVIIKKIYSHLFFTIFYLKYLYLLFRFSKRKLVVFDIDNTLADTWPSFNKCYESQRERLLSLDSFPAMIKLVNKYYDAGYLVVFLSARDYRYYCVTKKWVSDIGIYRRNLILVDSPLLKLKFILGKRNMEFYDDLSFGHESGNIKYYDEIIFRIKEMPNIKYFDYSDILKIQGGRE